MAKLVKSEILQREIRKDDLSQLGIPTPILAWELAKTNPEEAVRLYEYGLFELRQIHDVIVQTTCEWLQYMVDHLGEEHVPKVWGMMVSNLAATFRRLAGSEARERVFQFAETFRGHCGGPSGLGEITIREEADRFVMIHDPCGSGGKMRLSGKYGVTKKAHGWSWNKTGVPYYCTHCCLFWELTAIETCGYPLRIHENVDRQLEPCIQYVYKSPDLIPEQYFARVGARKDSARFAGKWGDGRSLDS